MFAIEAGTRQRALLISCDFFQLPLKGGLGRGESSLSFTRALSRDAPGCHRAGSLKIRRIHTGSRECSGVDDIHGVVSSVGVALVQRAASAVSSGSDSTVEPGSLSPRLQRCRCVAEAAVVRAGTVCEVRRTWCRLKCECGLFSTPACRLSIYILSREGEQRSRVRARQPVSVGSFRGHPTRGRALVSGCVNTSHISNHE